MKTNIRLQFYFILFVMSCAYSCKEGEPVELETADPLEVQFTISVSENLGSGRVSEAGRGAEEFEPYTILISIENSETGAVVIDGQEIKVLRFGNTTNFITDPLYLEPGSYTVTKFFALKKDGTIGWLIPKENSSKAHLVSDALPLEPFQVKVNETNNVQVELLSIGDNDDPKDYGFVTWILHQSKVLSLGIAVFERDTTLNELRNISADLLISDFTDTLIQTELDAGYNLLEFRNTGGEYYLGVSRKGYMPFDMRLLRDDILNFSENNEVLKIILEPDLQGKFARTGIVVEGSKEFRLLVRDLNGDGFNDIYGPQEGRLWFNNGKGEFFDSTNELPVTWGSAVDFDDFDLDGDTDLINLNQVRGDKVVIESWANDGQGHFSKVGEFSSGFLDHTLKLGDFDNDGDFDMVTGGLSGTLGGTGSIRFGLFIWENLGDFQFSLSKKIVTSNFMVAGDLDVGDFDGDNDIDVLIIANYLYSGTFLLRNKGDGTFSYEDLHINPGSLYFRFGANAVDYDNNGFSDFLIANSNSELVTSSSLLLNSKGHLSEKRLSDFIYFEGADFNRDGYEDLFATPNYKYNPFSAGSIHVMLNDGNGNFQKHQQIESNNKLPISADLNNDGIPDLILADYFNDRARHEIWFGY